MIPPTKHRGVWLRGWLGSGSIMQINMQAKKLDEIREIFKDTEPVLKTPNMYVYRPITDFK